MDNKIKIVLSKTFPPENRDWRKTYIIYVILSVDKVGCCVGQQQNN